MRNIALALLAAGGLAAAGTAPAQAVGSRYPYCLQGNDSPGLSDCSFTSYQQCQATASGRYLYCVENPFFRPEGGDPRAYRGRGRLRSVYPSY
jgi:hypothetical protein